MTTEIHRVLHRQDVSLKVGPLMDYFNCHSLLRGGGEWKKEQVLHFQLKQGRKFYVTINNTTVECLLSAKSLLSPFSLWPTVPKVQHGNLPFDDICFSRSLHWTLMTCSTFPGNPDTLVMVCVKLDSFYKHWGLLKVVVILLYLISGSSLCWPAFRFPFSFYPRSAFCSQITLFLLHAWHTI